MLFLISMGMAAAEVEQTYPEVKHRISNVISNFIVSNRDSFDDVESQQKLENFAKLMKKSFSVVHLNTFNDNRLRTNFS